MLDALEAEVRALRAKTQELVAVANGIGSSAVPATHAAPRKQTKRRSKPKRKTRAKQTKRQAKQTELALEQTNPTKPDEGEPKAGKRQALGRSLLQLRKSLLDRRAAEAKADEQDPPAT